MNIKRLISIFFCLSIFFFAVSANADTKKSFEIFIGQQKIENDQYYLVSDNIISSGTQENYNIFTDEKSGNIYFKDFAFSDNEMAATITIATDKDIHVNFSGNCSIITKSALESINIGILSNKGKNIKADISVDGLLSILNSGYAMDTIGIYASSPEIELALSGGKYKIVMSRGPELKKKAIKAENNINISNAIIDFHVYGSDEESQDASQYGIFSNGQISISNSEIKAVIDGKSDGAAIFTNNKDIIIKNSKIDISSNVAIASDCGNVKISGSMMSTNTHTSCIYVSNGNITIRNGHFTMRSEDVGIASDKNIYIYGNVDIKTQGFAVYTMGGKIKLPIGMKIPSDIEIRTFLYNDEFEITTFATEDSVVTPELEITSVVSGFGIKDLKNQHDFHIDINLDTKDKIIIGSVAAAIAIILIIILFIRRKPNKKKYKYQYCFNRYRQR